MAKPLILFGAWLSLVERLVRDQEAGGSNPLAPTISSLSLHGHGNAGVTTSILRSRDPSNSALAASVRLFGDGPHVKPPHPETNVRNRRFETQLLHQPYVPADSARSLTGESFRTLIETLLRVPYRTLREPATRKAPARAKEDRTEHRKSAPEVR